MGKKRGVIELWVLIELLVWFLAVMLFMFKINDIKNDTLFEKQFLARDIALTTETISNLPGDTLYTYQTNADLSKHEYVLSGTVKVFKSGESLEVTYPYYYDSHLSTNMNPLKSPKKIMFRKTGGMLDVAENLEAANANTCPVIDTKGQLAKVAVDYSDDAVAAGTALYGRLAADSSFIAISTRGPSPALIDDRIAKIGTDTSLVISVSKGSSLIVHHSPADKSRKLACLILNAYKASGKTGTASSSSEPILSRNPQGAAVRVELPEDMFQELPTLAYSAVRQYNG
jgi:hypothetical protein